jgi:succinate dehydrogenase / fumarate reductase membrane anchor subunit
MSIRTPLGQVRGLGAAKNGTAHWWMQRLTAIALIPLGIWLLASLVALIGADRGAVIAWLDRPIPAILMILLLTAGFYHLKLGLQVVIEDYVHAESTKLILQVLVNFACVGLGFACVFAVLKIAFGG